MEAGLEQFRDLPALILWGGKDFCFTGRFFEQASGSGKDIDYAYLQVQVEF
ncbi:MAG: hypothetical protein HY801_02695 [Candidatus Lindowbacteria bacterium]|nr:hypothetical protein [Candidatus Lindowbacteria bacterium]